MMVCTVKKQPWTLSRPRALWRERVNGEDFGEELIH